MRRSIKALIPTLALLASHSALAEICADRNGNADTAGVEKIVIAAGAGELDVQGSSTRRAVATGRACASDQKILDQIEIRIRRDGSILYIGAWLPQNLPSGFMKSHSASLDLKVSVPDSLPIEVADSSGETDIEHLHSLKISDSSGDLEIKDIAGKLELVDSSGDVSVSKVGGDVEVTSDSSGDLDIEKVSGAVRIRQDSSGDITVSEVRGDAEVNSDSSGSITVRDVGGDFTVGNDSSGGIRHTNVKGSIHLPSTN